MTVTTEARRVDGWWLATLAVAGVREVACLAESEAAARGDLLGMALSRATWLEATAAELQADVDVMTARAEALRAYAAKAAGGGR
jgi:hypothetical protein